VHNKRVSGGETPLRENSSDTLLGFETTGPLSLRPVWDTGGRLLLPAVGWGWRPEYGLGLVVVASLWWWGVVFDLWIVVASISHTAVLAFLVGVGGVCVCR
jgi:hypothetical protein